MGTWKWGFIPGILLAGLLVLTSCQTDRVRYDIGEWERFKDPKGFFPKRVIKREWAISHVIYYFSAAPEKLVGDPTLMLNAMAQFEWLINDLRSDFSSPHSLRRVMDARDELRELIRIPVTSSSKDAVQQLYSLSKFVNLTMPDNSSEPDEVVARRNHLHKIKGQLNQLVRATRKLYPAASETRRAHKG
jgi:hypothetical protein